MGSPMPDQPPRPRCKYLLAWCKEHKRLRFCNFEVLRRNIMLEPRVLNGPCPDDCRDFAARWPPEPDPELELCPGLPVEKSKDGA